MLTGLEVMFMGVTWSNSGFSVLQVLLSHLSEKEEGGGRTEGGENGIEKERKEGRRNKGRLEAR